MCREKGREEGGERERERERERICRPEITIDNEFSL